MTDTVSFQSRGLIDPRCITTMGVSVKEGDHPIGQFGTGLKYAIAIILRSGGDISIWRGLEELKFTRSAVQIRGKPVELVCMNGQELAFTTHLGEHWEIWQAFRELYCNTLDESGEHCAGEFTPIEGATTVIVRLEEFADCLKNLGDYVLLTQPVYEGDRAAFHPGPSRSIFYRGIIVGHYPEDKPHKYAVNIKEKLELTEDRTLKGYGDVAGAVAATIVGCRNAEFIEKFVGASREYAEHVADLDWGHTPTSQFMQVTCRLAERNEPMNRTALGVYKKHAPVPRPVESQLLPHEKTALAEAIKLCQDLGFPVDEYLITVVDSLGPNVLGTADRDAKEISIARDTFKASNQTLASTLLEEWVHIKHGHNDCTRSMQNWLFDSLIHMGRAYLDAKAGKS